MDKKQLADFLLLEFHRRNIKVVFLRDWNSFCSGTFNDIDALMSPSDLAVLEATLGQLAASNTIKYSVTKREDFHKFIIYDAKNSVTLDLDIFLQIQRFWWPLIQVSSLDVIYDETQNIYHISETNEFQITFAKEVLTYRSLREKQRSRLNEIWASLHTTDIRGLETELGLHKNRIIRILEGEKLSRLGKISFAVKMAHFSFAGFVTWLTNRRKR